MLRTIRVVRSQLIAELCKKVVQTVQKGGGASIMPTAKEYRLEAKAFLELADQANEFYVKTALIELARDYNRAARQAERRELDKDAVSNLQAHSR
jgi:hypothetical protein